MGNRRGHAAISIAGIGLALQVPRWPVALRPGICRGVKLWFGLCEAGIGRSLAGQRQIAFAVSVRPALLSNLG
jgi:hypothetical protein